MPPKFRKHIWVKRGDYLITESIPEGHKVKGEIVRILTRDHIRYFVRCGSWPTEFTAPLSKNVTSEENDFLTAGNPNKLDTLLESSDDNTSSNEEEEETSDEPKGKRSTIVIPETAAEKSGSNDLNNSNSHLLPDVT